MHSALNFLFASEIADRINKFLRTRGQRTRIVAPAWVRDHIAAHISEDAHRAPQASWAEEIGVPAPKSDGIWNYVIIAEDAKRERALAEELSNHKGIKVYGLFADVLPALLCGASGFSRGASTQDIKRYAVLCVPRSGSRYLISVLNRHGLGLPVEHLREPLAVAVTDGKLGFKNAVGALERFGQRNSVFGTKLISTFLIRACNGSLPRMENNIGWMTERGYRFVHLDRPLNDSVISNYIATRLQKWHFFEQMDDSTKGVLDKLEFDRDAAWNEYIRFHAQKLVVAHLAGKFSMPSFSYETIRNSVDEVVSSVCERLDVDPANLEAGSASVPVSTRAESDTYDNLSEALANLLDDRRDEIVPSTIRMLRNLVGTEKPAAERLIAAYEP